MATSLTNGITILLRNQGAVLLMVGRSYVGNDVTHSTLLDRACTCSYKNLPEYRSYRVGNTAPRDPGTVALTVGSVPRRIVPKLSHFHWPSKMNNQLN